MAARLCLNVHLHCCAESARHTLRCPASGSRRRRPSACSVSIPETWDAALAALLDAKFLSLTHNGLFALLAIQA